MPDIDSAEPDDEANSELAEAHLAQHSRRQPSPASLKLPNLNAFASVQRQIAGLDLSVVTAAHRELSQAIVAANAPTIAAAQEAARAYFARSIDFSRLAAAQRAVMSNAAVAAMPVRLEWAKALGAAIDVSALEHAYNAILSTDALRTVQESNRAVTEALRSRVDLSAEAVKALQLGLPRLDFAKVLQAFGRWIPKNLRDVDDLEGVAKVTLDEGVPLSWVPRTEIVVELLNAATVDERLKILHARQDDVLDDCEALLAEYEHECAAQCLQAIRALRAGFGPPAQSHAANIIDSIVLRLLGQNGRAEASQRAQEDFDEFPLQLAAENLTLRPLFRAFTKWWPSSKVPPPTFFARHPTAHAVGYTNVFVDTSALVAVMLATSLTVQFSGGLDPEGDSTAP